MNILTSNISNKISASVLGLAVLILACINGPVKAQGVGTNPSGGGNLVLTNVGPASLEFGTLAQNSGLIQIILTDPEVVVYEIEGNAKKNVVVTFTPPASLVLDASNIIPYTFRAAYANNGNNDVSEATVISGTSVTFPVSATGTGSQGNQAKAYLYIYGDITVGNVASGNYSGTINFNVQYE